MYYAHTLHTGIIEVVISLDAGDEYLKERVMNLSESVVAGTHYTEDGIHYCKRGIVHTSYILVCDSLNVYVHRQANNPWTAAVLSLLHVTLLLQ